MNASSPRPFHGFSLIEILLVVGVVAVLAVAAFAIYSRVRASSMAQSDARQLLGVMAGIEGLVGPGGNYHGLSNGVLNKAGLIPANMNAGNKTTANLTNRFGGRVSFIDTAGAAGGCSTTYCPGMRLDYYGLPSEGCATFVKIVASRFRYVYARPDETGSSWSVIQNPANPLTAGWLINGCSRADKLVVLMAT